MRGSAVRGAGRGVAEGRIGTLVAVGELTTGVGMVVAVFVAVGIVVAVGMVVAVFVAVGIVVAVFVAVGMVVAVNVGGCAVCVNAAGRAA